MGLVVFCKERRTNSSYSHTSITSLYLVVWGVENMEDCDRFVFVLFFFFFPVEMTLFGNMAGRQAVFPNIYSLGGILANLFKGNYLFHN